MLVINNQGKDIIYTNYWQSTLATQGYFYLSWNAGCARVLIPDSQKAMLNEIESATVVIISQGPWIGKDGRDALEIIWEDFSDSPYVITIGAEQTDRNILETVQGSGFDVAVLTRDGLFKIWKGKYRRVSSLPCLRSWESH